MTQPLRIISILLIGILLGASAFFLSTRDNQQASLTIVNDASLPLSKYSLQYNACGQNIEISGNYLEVQQKITLSLTTCYKGHPKYTNHFNLNIHASNKDFTATTYKSDVQLGEQLKYRIIDGQILLGRRSLGD